MNQDIENIKEQLQTVIGTLIGKEYSEYEAECSCPSRENITITPEPTLNDVLLAIGKKHEGYKYWIDCNGDVFEFISGGEYTEEIIILHYDIEKSIFNQSDKTKLAIIKLLE